VSFGDGVAYGSTLQDALTKVFKTSVDTGEQPPGTKIPPPNQQNQTVKQALADAQAAYTRAQAALKNGDLAGYQTAVDQMKAALDKAVAAGNAVTPSPTPTPQPSGSPSTPASPPASTTPSSPPTSPSG
jgi:hypothetical protein